MPFILVPFDPETAPTISIRGYGRTKYEGLKNDFKWSDFLALDSEDELKDYFETNSFLVNDLIISANDSNGEPMTSQPNIGFK